MFTVFEKETSSRSPIYKETEENTLKTVLISQIAFRSFEAPINFRHDTYRTQKFASNARNKPSIIHEFYWSAEARNYRPFEILSQTI